jgi:carboxyl-terminal processing protease
MGQSGWPLAELGLATSAVPAEARDTFAPFWEVWNLVQSRYFDQPVPATQLTEGAIDGMLNTLGDPNTRYLPPQQEEAERTRLEGEFEGIGILVEMVDDQITVVSPFEGSPAEAAGIRTGDVLLEADSIDLADMDLAEAADVIRGPAGTDVHLKILRGDDVLEFDVTRAAIEIPSVRGEMLDNSLAYVRINRFGDRTPDQLRTTLETLLEQEPVGLILDLRNNPGGGLDAAVEIADEFLGEGVVVIERFGDGEERTLRSDAAGMAQEIPMIVLINEGSASASELLAGAIRDRGRGTLVGVTSFGKGTVQTWHQLSNGGGVRITTARWLTPDGHWVHEVGLMPDVRIPLPESAPDGQLPEDTQLQAAKDLLLGKEVESVAPVEAEATPQP